jgi:sugar/nucleoside kinase (ribokinase family)
LTEHPSILCAGGAVQDIVMRVEAFPAAGMKVQASDFVITVGGQAGNAAVAVARLGARVRYAGPLGDKSDIIANAIVSSLEREGIDCRFALRVAGATSSVSTIMLDATGEKMIATRRGGGLSEAVPADAEAAVEGLDAALLDNRYATFCLPIGEAAKARGIPRVLDFDQMAPLDDAMLALSTHVIASAEALRSSTGQSELDAALLALGRHYRGFLAVTNGPEGVYWLEGGAVRHMDAFRVDAIDTLGAGDTFHGAFTVRLVETGDVVAAMRFASAAAAIKCTRFGGQMGAATRAEVEGFLRERAQ